ncbi:hypothetical protein [Mesorhizobium sp. KR9-304]|uniref:hypothetical protein n=1 Tax=Mesorhizobium sp. KR9-304 TaxID=3156614 RepID=UPI0032B4E9D2
MNWRRGATVGAVVAGGYLAAVFVATLVVIAITLSFASLFAGNDPEPFGNRAMEFAGFVLAGMVITFATALPGFLVVVWLSLSLRWNRWWRFALAGGIDAVVAIGLFNIFSGGASLVPVGLVLPTLPGGLAGGAIYWLVAGRFVDRVAGRQLP